MIVVVDCGGGRVFTTWGSLILSWSRVFALRRQGPEAKRLPPNGWAGSDVLAPRRHCAWSIGRAFLPSTPGPCRRSGNRVDAGIARRKLFGRFHRTMPRKLLPSRHRARSFRLGHVWGRLISDFDFCCVRPIDFSRLSYSLSFLLPHFYFIIAICTNFRVKRTSTHFFNVYSALYTLYSLNSYSHFSTSIKTNKLQQSKK